jgi:hypothetical protein
LAQVSAIMQPNSAVKVKFAGYEIDIVDVRRAGSKAPVVVTFQVDKAEAEDKPQPQSGRLSRRSSRTNTQAVSVSLL